jgi:hypothetical protein
MSTVRATGNEGALQAANLLAGDKPTWTLNSGTTAGPTSVGSGVSVAGSLKAQVALQLRTPTDFAPRRVCKVTIPVFDALSTYTVGISGNNYSGNEASRAAALEAITTALNAGATLAQAENLDEDSDGFTDAILITGTSVTGYYITSQVSGGSGTILVEGDPANATARVYGLPRASANTQSSVRPLSWMLIAILYPEGNGLCDTIDTDGLERVHVWIEAAKDFSDGTITLRAPKAWIGPTLLGGA